MGGIHFPKTTRRKIFISYKGIKADTYKNSLKVIKKTQSSFFTKTSFFLTKANFSLTVNLHYNFKTKVIMKNPQDVFESHMKAVDTLDANNVANDYTDDALFITPDKTYRGKEEICDFYKEFLPNFKDFEFITIKQETHDNVVYFV